MRKHLKKTTKRAIMASSLAGLAAVGIVSTSGYALAHRSGQDSNPNPVSKEARQNRGEQRQKHQQERLDQLVKSGKLTQEQADKLKAKHEEMRSKKEAAHKQTDPTKRKAAHEAIRDEMRQWAKDSGIYFEAIKPDRKEMRGMGGMRYGTHSGPNTQVAQ